RAASSSSATRRNPDASRCRAAVTMRAKKRCHSSRAATGSLALSCSIQIVTECEEGCIGWAEFGAGDDGDSRVQSRATPLALQWLATGYRAGRVLSLPAIRLS